MVVEPKSSVAIWLIINLQILTFISLRSYHSLFSYSLFSNIRTNVTILTILSIKNAVRNEHLISFELCLVS